MSLQREVMFAGGVAELAGVLCITSKIASCGERENTNINTHLMLKILLLPQTVIQSKLNHKLILFFFFFYIYTYKCMEIKSEIQNPEINLHSN